MSRAKVNLSLRKAYDNPCWRLELCDFIYKSFDKMHSLGWGPSEVNLPYYSVRPVHSVPHPLLAYIEEHAKTNNIRHERRSPLTEKGQVQSGTREQP